MQLYSFSGPAPLRLCERLILIALIAGVWNPASAEAPPRPQTALRQAAEYLWSQQASDGAWHSPQYAMLRSGQALTSFVLHALLQVPESVCPRPAGGLDRALDFIRVHVDENGSLGHADTDIIEYPVYSTAYALMCLGKAGTPDDLKLALRMRDFLMQAQRIESNGFGQSSPAFGGWGFDIPTASGEPGHMDLAHTRCALAALSGFEERWPSSPPPQFAFDLRATYAESFLRVVQRHPKATAPQPRPTNGEPAISPAPYDGGFYFSPVVAAANKGREEKSKGQGGASYFRSYATATCDGILALLAAGVDRRDERVARAVQWLRAHQDFSYPQGVPTDHSEPWGEAIRFYHFAARAEAYAALDWPGDWRSRLAATVAKEQAHDGSFRNAASPLMKEDDPLLCTALAITALSHCQAKGVE